MSPPPISITTIICEPIPRRNRDTTVLICAVDVCIHSRQVAPAPHGCAEMRCKNDGDNCRLPVLSHRSDISALLSAQSARLDAQKAHNDAVDFVPATTKRRCSARRRNRTHSFFELPLASVTAKYYKRP
jgi:hypothetical protein